MGRHKGTSSEIKELVKAECPDHKHPDKCIWGYTCKHFLEKDEDCKVFDQYIPHYKEMYAKEEARKHKR
jgi:hypothetical protein